MNPWLVFILAVIICGYLLELVVTLLNIQALSPLLPEEFKDTFKQDDYQKSQEYTRATSRFGLVENSLSTVGVLLFLLLGGFNTFDLFARGFGYGPIITGLLYGALFLMMTSILSLPFSIYSTFVIEERFGFNRTTIRTFITDLIKVTLLSIVIGGPLLALVLWFFETSGEWAWFYCWIGVTVISITLQLLAPVIIMPLFNTFTPLEDDPLKAKITAYARQQKFTMQGIFTMDGSKRSTKANAFFTGFGRLKKIVFYDNLIDQLTDEELVAVLAHEMGHNKLHHIPKLIVASILQTGLMFYLLSLFIHNEGLHQAFFMEHLSIYAGLLFFGFLYTPISLLTSILFHLYSRKKEFEADSYGAESTKGPQHLINGLKKLSRTNLSNLTPHPVYVFLHYAHPPVLERIHQLRTHSIQPGEQS